MDRLIPNIGTLRAFEAVGRHLNFTRAAEELNLTQAAVSYRIRTLEAGLGFRLFSRRNQGVLLTDDGRAYLSVVRGALRHLEDGTTWLIARKRHEVRTLRILVMQAFASLWLMPRLQRFRSLHPEIEVQLVSWIGGVTRLDAVEFDRHGIDATILRSSAGESFPDLYTEPLVSDCALPVASPASLQSKSVKAPADLREHVLLHAMTWPEIWDRWLETMGIADLEPAGEMRLQHTGFTVQAAVSGLGVAMAHVPLVTDELADGRLIAPLCMGLPIDCSYCFVCPVDRIDVPAVAHFRDWIRGEMIAPPGLTAGSLV